MQLHTSVTGALRIQPTTSPPLVAWPQNSSNLGTCTPSSLSPPSTDACCSSPCRPDSSTSLIRRGSAFVVGRSTPTNDERCSRLPFRELGDHGNGRVLTA